MPRIARVVVPGLPHHVTQRGNRRQRTFFCDEDYRAYLQLMGQRGARCGVEIWAYCLMPNHVHLVAVPEAEDSLRSAIGEANRRYAQRVNDRQGWRGHLWQERFASFPIDENHLLAAVRYVELNPVRARLAPDAGGYPWSSAAAHMAGRGDGIVNVAPLLDVVGEWGDFLSCEPSDEELDALRRHERTGRPLGGEGFVKGLEKAMGRSFSPRKRGRKPLSRATPTGRAPN